MPVARSSASEPVPNHRDRLGLLVVAEGHDRPLAELLLHRDDDPLQRLHLVRELLHHDGLFFSFSVLVAPNERSARGAGPAERAELIRRRSGGDARGAAVEHARADGFGDVGRRDARSPLRGPRSCGRRAGPFRTRAPRGRASPPPSPRRRAPSSQSAATRSRSRGASDAFVDADASPASCRARCTRPRALHALADGRARLGDRPPLERRHAHRRERDVDVDPIEERPAQPRAVLGDPFARAAAAFRPVAEVAARARIHRADDDRARGEGGLRVRARDGDDAVLERLPERFERARGGTRRARRGRGRRGARGSPRPGGGRSAPPPTRPTSLTV